MVTTQRKSGSNHYPINSLRHAGLDPAPSKLIKTGSWVWPDDKPGYIGSCITTPKPLIKFNSSGTNPSIVNGATLESNQNRSVQRQ